MARVIAIARGHDGKVIREEGEAFDVPDARLKDGSTWFVPEDKAAEALKPAAARKNARPPGSGPLRGSEATGAD